MFLEGTREHRINGYGFLSGTILDYQGTPMPTLKGPFASLKLTVAHIIWPVGLSVHLPTALRVTPAN